jgi:hypothetical protein
MELKERVRNASVGHFGWIFATRGRAKFSLQANSFPSALRFAVADSNIMPRCDPELMHDCIADDRTKPVSC